MSNGFTVKETAEYFGVSDKTVFAWIRDGKIEATNVGCKNGSKPRYFVSEEAVEKLEATRKPRKKKEKKTGSSQFYNSLTDEQKGHLADFMSGLFNLMETTSPEQQSYIKKPILEIVDPAYRERIREVLNEKA